MRQRMTNELSGWQIVSERTNPHEPLDLILGIIMGARPMPLTTYTVRDIATGSVRDVTCFGRSDLAERVRKAQFDGLYDNDEE